jgi:hypothetical protein
MKAGETPSGPQFEPKGVTPTKICESAKRTASIIFEELEERLKEAGVTRKTDKTLSQIPGILERLVQYAINEVVHDALPEGETPSTLSAALSKIKQLEGWKQSQLAVTPDWHAIAKVIGVGLGESVPDKVLPYIQAVQAELADLKACNESLHKLCQRVWKAVEPTGEYEGEKDLVEFATSVRVERDAAEAELREARHEMSQCDDIKLDQPLANCINELQRSREAADKRRK